MLEHVDAVAASAGDVGIARAPHVAFAFVDLVPVLKVVTAETLWKNKVGRNQSTQIEINTGTILYMCLNLMTSAFDRDIETSALRITALQKFTVISLSVFRASLRRPHSCQYIYLAIYIYLKRARKCSVWTHGI